MKTVNKLILLMPLVMILSGIFVSADNGNDFAYFNLSQYDDDETLIDFWGTTDTLLNGFFSLFLVMIVIVIPILLMIKTGKEPIDAIHLGALYGLLFSIFMYISQAMTSTITKPGLYIFVPAVIYSISLAVKWYNKR